MTSPRIDGAVDHERGNVVLKDCGLGFFIYVFCICITTVNCRCIDAYRKTVRTLSLTWTFFWSILEFMKKNWNFDATHVPKHSIPSILSGTISLNIPFIHGQKSLDPGKFCFF